MANGKHLTSPSSTLARPLIWVQILVLSFGHAVLPLGLLIGIHFNRLCSLSNSSTVVCVHQADLAYITSLGLITLLAILYAVLVELPLQLVDPDNLTTAQSGSTQRVSKILPNHQQQRLEGWVKTGFVAFWAGLRGHARSMQVIGVISGIVAG